VRNFAPGRGLIGQTRQRNRPLFEEDRMSSVHRPRLTYANVTATLALFLALSGGAYAATALPRNSVGRRQIKNNAVNAAKVLDGSLRGADIKESSLTRVPSATNAVHAAAAGAIDKVTYKSATSGVPGVAPGPVVTPVATGTVTCNPGQRVISGGVKVDNPAEAFVIDSYPDVGNTAWTVRVGNAGAPPVGFTVVAVCTAVTAAG
jgi:hypothetical protein